MKKLMIIILSALMALTLFGCKKDKDIEKVELNVWFVDSVAVCEQSKAIAEAFSAKCEELGFNGTYVNPSKDKEISEVIDFCQQAIDDHADVLICDWFSYGLTDIAKQAKNADITLIAYNNALDEDIFACTFGYDGTAYGELLAESLYAKRSKRNNTILYIGDSLSSAFSVAASSAFVSKMQQLMSNCAITVDYADDDAEYVRLIIEQGAIQMGYTEIVCEGQLATLVAGQYKNQYEISDAALYIVGASNEGEISSLLNAGIINCTLVKDYQSVGYTAAQLAYDALLKPAGAQKVNLSATAVYSNAE